MLLRRVPRETGDGGQTASPNVLRLVGFLIILCLASAAGISKSPPPPSDAEKVPPVGDAASRHQITLEDAEENDLLPLQSDGETSFADGKQGPQQKYFLSEEDAMISDGRDRSAAAAGDTGDASPGEDPNLRAAPKYMLELYRKFSNDKYSHPIANIVRSFLNINTGVLPIWTMGNRTRIALHTLLFNISSINRDEEIYLAELRLYAAKKTQRVLVYEVVHQIPAGASVDGENSPPSRRYQLLTTREIPRGHGNWETFSVTEVVRRWVRTQATAGHILEVRVDTARSEAANGESEGDGGAADELDEEEEQEEEEQPVEEGGERNGAYEPILVVFSNDRKRRKIELRELHEIQSHENGLGEDEEASEYPSSPSSSTAYSSSTSSTMSGGEEEEEDYEDEEDRDGVRLNATTTGADGPEELDDEKRYPNLLESLSKSTDRVSTPSAWKKLPRVKRSLNRSRRRRAKKNACRRKPMWVDFGDVQWDRWIIEPRGYQAYECTGQCYFPVGEHLTPTKYAMIKSLLHATYPKKFAAVCCVPTRLEPISLLYIDEHGTVTYKYKYDGMVVAECGCR